MLQRSARLVIILGKRTTYLHLGQAIGETLLESVLLRVLHRQPERLIRSFVCFKLIALLKAHSEVASALAGLVLLDGLFVDVCTTSLSKRAFILAHIV